MWIHVVIRMELYCTINLCDSVKLLGVLDSDRVISGRGHLINDRVETTEAAPR